MIGTQGDEELPDVGWFEDTLDDDDEDGSNMFVGVVFSAVVMTVEEEKTGLFTAMEGELFRDNFCAFSAFKRSFND